MQLLVSQAPGSARFDSSACGLSSAAGSVRTVSLYETLLFLHVLLAFALVAGIVAYGYVVFGDGDRLRGVLAAPALTLWNVGGLGVLVFGIWLAIEVDAYEIWDGWIIAAIVLWLIVSAAGGPLSKAVRDTETVLDAGRARLLFAVMSAGTLLLLIDMIFKPGA